jgi:hypothetical protein
MTTVLKLSGVFFLSSWTRTLMGSGLMAGPRGFEPPFSGSEGRRLDPDWATGPKEN